jgi:hypothetical protein
MYFLVLTIKSRFRVCIVNRGDRTLSCRADELVRPYLARLSAFRDMKRRWFEGLCGECDELLVNRTCPATPTFMLSGGPRRRVSKTSASLPGT